ncbi:MAG: endonuclease Q family protein [Clostridiales bacterium]|jgi:uncharacterized protein (TIGR00375 family)|nr:endonuclease Q family protein [Clostridiales bacterium]
MFAADLHIHSKYSYATSKSSEPETLAAWADKKGLDLIGTGDFTHEAWRNELALCLEPLGNGLYKHPKYNVRFIITGEISSIYKQNGKTRKVHSLILLPDIEAAIALSTHLRTIGNLRSDGRPILGISARELLEITMYICPDAVFIPAHIWTPHYSVFGASSGFDSVEECFGDLSKFIFALETGLSSDQIMNRRISALDKYVLISNSDAHSPSNLAREANLFDTDMDYKSIAHALRTGKGFAGTLEFFPEQGKYHFDGHRNCGISRDPRENPGDRPICPVCGKKLTPGVLRRVVQFSDRREPISVQHFEYITPLTDIIHAAFGYSSVSKKSVLLYNELINNFRSELLILRNAELEDIKLVGGAPLADGIRRMREGKIKLTPGFDGEYGKIHIF